jgi:hypothetical protein
MEHEPRSRLSLKSLAIICVAAILIAVLVAGPIMFVVSFRSARTNLLARRGEAMAWIQAVYQYYGRNGTWPTEARIERTTAMLLPKDWEFLNGSAGDGPTLLLAGDFHMRIYYQFYPPRNGAISSQWGLSEEGDKSTFVVDPPYPDSWACDPNEPPQASRKLGIGSLREEKPVKLWGAEQ